jgi:Glycosyltransferase family 87
LLWAGAALLVGVLQYGTFMGAVRHGPGVVSDFYQDWASARNWWNGLPVYTNHRVTIPRYIGPVDPFCLQVEFNAHPPSSVLVMIPWAMLDYRDALLASNVLSLAMLVASLEIIRRSLELPLNLELIAQMVIFLLLSSPLFMQLFHGQWNLILLLINTLAWAAERSGRPAWAGVLLGVATAIKLYPGFLFLYFLARRRWTGVIVGALAFGMLTGLTAAVLGTETYRVYIQEVLPTLATVRSSWYNASLVSFWTRLFDPLTAEEHVLPLWRSRMALRVAILLSALAVIITVARVVRSAKTRTALDHAFGVAVTGMLLLSPATWDHSFLLLLLPISILLNDPPPSEAAKALLAVSLAAIWFFAHRQVCARLIPGGLVAGFASPAHALTVLAYPCYALVTLFVIEAIRAKSAGPDFQAARPIS